jgi:integrase
MSILGQCLENASGFFKQMVTVAFFTGVRTGELLALKWSDINFVTKEITISKSMRRGVLSSTKTRKARKIDMLPPIVEEALRLQFRETGLSKEFIFVNEAGDNFQGSKEVLEKYWYPLLKSCGIEQRIFYNTRHTFASQMLSNGEDPLWVSKMLGHSNVSTTFNFYSGFIKTESVKRGKFLDTFWTQGEDKKVTNIA